MFKTNEDTPTARGSYGDRRIEGWDASGQPIGGLRPQQNETRITTLAGHYGALADSVATDELEKAKAEVENVFLKHAKLGKRAFTWYPSDLALRYKELLIKWMKDDGVTVDWKCDQRDGTWVSINY